MKRHTMLRRTLGALALSAAGVLAVACGDAVAPLPRSGAAPPNLASAQKLGQCLLQLDLTGNKVEPIVERNITVNAPAGQVVTLVSIKAGTACWLTPAGTSGTYTFSFDGTPCYVVAGLGAATATVTRVGNGSDCKDISNIEYFTAPPAPTTGFLQICVVVVGDTPPPPGSLTFQFPFVVAGQQIPVANGTCSNSIELPGGATVISELPNTFSIALWSAVTAPIDRLVGFDLAAQTATVTVVTGSTTVVTITNLVGEPDHGLD
jgi:hypothetical protein